LQQALLGRFAELPRATRSLLLVGSVDEEATLDEVLTAAAQLGKDMPATSKDLAPAVALEIIVHDHRRIGFRHPLLPVAIYQAAKPEERHCAHAALAAALLDHPDRRTWHRAASTTGRDEDVAVELERAWVGATTRGTPSIAIAALERAADITVDSSRRDRRLLRAAELAVEIGEADRASRLLGEIDATTFESLDRQRIRLVQDLIEPEVPPNPMAVDWLVDAAKLARSQGEFDVALGLLQAAAMRFWWADPGPDVRRRVVGALQEVPAPRNDPRVLSIRGICDPIGCGGPLSEIVTHTAPDACDPKAALWLGSALHAAGAFDISTTFLTAAVAGLRQQGWLRLLPQGLAQQAWNAIYTGDWNSASAAAEEAAGLARETHQVVWEAVAQTARSMVAAITGDDESAESLLRRAEALVLPLAANAVLADVQLVRAVVALGRGRYEEAFQHLQRTFDPHDPAHHHFRSSWCIGEFVEAAARAGHGHQAREQLARSEGLARRSLSPRLQAGLIYARPLLAENDTAEAEFQSALRADLTRWPLYRARLLLEYGTWLRRRRRIAEARMPLRAAHEAFVALGAVPWGERARQELRASRETGNNKPGAWDQLTEQQLQIAQMAAQGLANREIAQRLYISPAPSVLTCTASSPNSVSPPERRCRRPSRTAGQRLWHREEPTVTDTTQARSTHP
jgi:tetratricopeptide (TPR) repeat protein